MKRILVVDDERVLAETLTMILKNDGYSVMSAGDGRQATQLIEENRPDLVISDLAMPNMDGLKLLEWLRDHRSLDGVKFVMMTGKGNVLEPLKNYRPGADGYLAKPFVENDLLMLVENLIGRVSAGG